MNYLKVTFFLSLSAILWLGLFELLAFLNRSQTNALLRGAMVELSQGKAIREVKPFIFSPETSFLTPLLPCNLKSLNDSISFINRENSLENLIGRYQKSKLPVPEEITSLLMEYRTRLAELTLQRERSLPVSELEKEAENLKKEIVEKLKLLNRERLIQELILCFDDTPHPITEFYNKHVKSLIDSLL